MTGSDHFRHQEAIVDQFTRQAVPFAQKLEHLQQEAMEKEKQLRASFPHPGDDEKIRKMLREDVGRDRLGVGTHWQGNELHFAYPVLILMGKKGA